MLYRVLCESDAGDIAVLAIEPSALDIEGVLITDGNAASNSTNIYRVSEIKTVLPLIEGLKNLDWWDDGDGSKRRIMSECLIPNEISPDLIKTIYVSHKSKVESIRAIISEKKINVISEPRMFFLPERAIGLTENLSLLEGDMFFSRLHTLTISVNTVGVMGKGLASTAKYRFPWVYLAYQELCKKGEMKMGRPWLYTRDSSFDFQLAEEPESLPKINTQTWFLLFPTKNHWREEADFDGIIKGLNWLINNYKNEGIMSIAVPALGCGLGKLDWGKMGPILCEFLSKLDIKVSLYLPTERRIPEDQFTKEFLLR
jgi:hypothetical protein